MDLILSHLNSPKIYMTPQLFQYQLRQFFPHELTYGVELGPTQTKKYFYEGNEIAWIFIPQPKLYRLNTLFMFNKLEMILPFLHFRLLLLSWRHSLPKWNLSHQKLVKEMARFVFNHELLPIRNYKLRSLLNSHV